MMGTTASCPLASTGLRRLLDLVDEIVGGVLRRHSRIHEADQVGERVIAEQQVHPRIGILVAIDRVEPVRQSEFRWP